MLHVDSWNVHVKDACLIGKYYTIMTADVNANTFQGEDGTDGTSFSPADRYKDIHLSLFSKQQNAKKCQQFTKRKLKKEPYHKTISSGILLSLF